MSILDKNKIFFGLIHYIFSEQQNVNWAFKTSLVNFTGINTTIENKKYKQANLSDSVIDYIREVKPYHVQFEQYIEKYSSQQDEANVKASDKLNTEINIRFDAVTSEVDEQGNMTDIEYMNTHMANRLYYYKTHDLDIIKDYLDCHFKGITVDAGSLNIDKYGYDAFLYDSTLYDAPTITAEYCLVNMKENFNFPYTKKFISVGISSFQIDTNESISKSNITLTSTYKGKQEFINNYSIDNNIITLFYNTRPFEKISVIYDDGNNKQGYIFVSYPFTESSDEKSPKQFVHFTERTFKIPNNNISSSKITVHIENMNGSRFPISTNGYEINDGYITVYDNKISENWKVLITVIDYQYIYDKIYTWEDLYGVANNITPYSLYYENYNNIQNLDGENLLRPQYEAERPSELSVVYPQNNVFIYTENKSKKVKNIYNIDFKNEQYSLPISKITKLSKDFNIGDKELYVDDISKLELPYKDDDTLIPGIILINSELIKFYNYEKLENNKVKLFQLSRAADGSYFCQEHKANDLVYPIINKNKKTIETKNQTNSFLIKENSKNEFDILGDYSNENKIEVWKKEHIQLLTNIKLSSKYFDISSNNIHLPSENETGKIYIDDDIIPFKTIEKIEDDRYRISNFNIDKEYSKETSYILSKNPTQLDSSEYTFKIEDFESDNENKKFNKRRKYIVLKNMAKKDEIIMVVNRS